MRVSKLMGVVAAVFVALSMLASTTLAVHAESKVVGDINDDRRVDVIDFVLVCHAMHTHPGQYQNGTGWDQWNPEADISGPEGTPDGEIDGWDLSTVTLAYPYP